MRDLRPVCKGRDGHTGSQGLQTKNTMLGEKTVCCIRLLVAG